VTVQLGSVVTDDEDRLLVAWDWLSNGVRLGMPLHYQTHQLHRAQVRLDLSETQDLLRDRVIRAPMLIDTRARHLIAAQAHVLGQADPALISRIARTFERARMASNVERAA